jgi:hypothetical protein
MAEDVLKYCATDKEIFDLLMAAKQRISLAILHEIAKKRGIFYSPNEVREDLVTYLSLLPYDYEALDDLLVLSTNPNRAEKVTSVALNTKVSTEELKELVKDLQAQVGVEEKITSRPETSDRYVVQLEYSEIDFARTRLLQRREREADIRFVTEGENTTIRMPANEKARDFVSRITRALEQKRLQPIPTDNIDVSDLSPDERTQFFTKLMTKMKDYTSKGVSNVRVHKGVADSSPDEEVDESYDDQAGAEVDADTVEAAEEMLYIVEHVVLNGKMLMASPEYQQLTEKGFYVTSITWVAQQNHGPHNRIEFEAGFEHPKQGEAFRYNVRGLYRKRKGKGYTKTLRPVDEGDKQVLFPIIEQTAREVLAELKNKGKDAATEEAN